jgi:3-oxoacyl-[acyl-carrier protein] reductase
MDLQISGKKALVLGASRGLGAAIAAGLAAEGVKVFAAARSADKIHATDNIVPVAVDLSDAASVAALIAMLAEQDGVDILVNNSGRPEGRSGTRPVERKLALPPSSRWRRRSFRSPTP